MVVDASGVSLGRVATGVAMALMGKDDPAFKREAFSGRPVRVTNASKVKIYPTKLKQMYHTRFSGYPGGLRVIKWQETIDKKGHSELVKLAVYQMLPKNKLRKEMMKNLTVEE